MNIKKMLKNHFKASEVPKLSQDIKGVLHIQDKQRVAYIKKELRLKLSVTFILVVCVAILSVIRVYQPQNPVQPPIVDNNDGDDNGGGNSIRLLSQVIEQMRNNSYTLTIAIDGSSVYEYKIEESRIELNFFFNGTATKLTYYLDTLNEELPYFYSTFDGLNWIQSIELRSVLDDGYLAPMNWLDPMIIEDEWFDFDETLQTYILKETFKKTILENSTLPLFNLVDVHITMNENNDITFTLKGQDEGTSVYLSEFSITYSNIGLTEVDIPENVIERSTDIVDIVLNALSIHSDNHYFTFKLNEVEAFKQQLVFGTRFNDAFLTTNNTTNTQTYVGVVDGNYTEIIKTSDSYEEKTLTKEMYDGALEAFYPLRFENFSKDWFDLSAPTLHSVIGISYPILESYYDQIINFSTALDVRVLDAYVSFKPTFDFGYIFDVFMSLDIGGVAYTVSYSVYGLSKVELLPKPTPIGEKLSLFDMVSIALETNQYTLQQFRVVNDTKIQELELSKDNFNYLVLQSLGNSNYRYDMYGFEDESFVVIRGLYDVNFVVQTIDLVTYENDLEVLQFIHLDKLKIALEETDEDVIELDQELFLSISNAFLTSNFTFVSGSVFVTYAFSSNPVFTVNVELLSKSDNQQVTFEISYKDLGEVELKFPTQQQTNVSSVMTLLSLMIDKESYVLQQFLIVGDVETLNLELYRDGSTYTDTTFNNGVDSITMYSIVNGMYTSFEVFNDSRLETKVIDKSTYEDATFKRQWIQFETLNVDTFQDVFKQNDTWFIVESIWVQLLSSDVLALYENFIGTISFKQDDIGDFLVFSVRALEKSTGEYVLLEMYVYDIDVVEILLPQA